MAGTGDADSGGARGLGEAIVDANVLVRFLTEDPPQMADRADRVLGAAEDGQTGFVVTPVTLAEVVFVLESRYGWRRRDIVAGMTGLLSAGALDFLERRVVERALGWYGSLPAVHYADAYVAAVAVERGHGAVVSFDRALRRVPGVRLIERESDLDARPGGR